MLHSYFFFYGFLNGGGWRFVISPFLWKGIYTSNSLAWNNKILTLENLANRRCNKLLTTTCVNRHSATKSIYHLFILYPFVKHMWRYFGCLLRLDCYTSLGDIWLMWRSHLKSLLRETGISWARLLIVTFGLRETSEFLILECGIQIWFRLKWTDDSSLCIYSTGGKKDEGGRLD